MSWEQKTDRIHGVRSFPSTGGIRVSIRPAVFPTADFLEESPHLSGLVGMGIPTSRHWPRHDHPATDREVAFFRLVAPSSLPC